jgi:hypothetical protein
MCPIPPCQSCTRRRARSDMVLSWVPKKPVAPAWITASMKTAYLLFATAYQQRNRPSKTKEKSRAYHFPRCTFVNIRSWSIRCQPREATSSHQACLRSSLVTITGISPVTPFCSRSSARRASTCALHTLSGAKHCVSGSSSSHHPPKSPWRTWMAMYW